MTLKYKRKLLYINDDEPVLGVSDDMHVGVSVRGQLKDADLLVLGLRFCLTDPDWRDALIEKTRSKIGAREGDDTFKKIERLCGAMGLQKAS